MHMRSLKSLMTLLALLAFSLQTLAAPVGLSCAHPAPDQSMQQMQDDAHAHHAMHDQDDADVTQLNCDMGCNCGGGCVHACQLSAVQLNVWAAAPLPEALLVDNRFGTTHHAYTHPLLRPPAIS